MLLTIRQRKLETKTIDITFVVPVFNEEANIGTFIDTLTTEATKLTSRFKILLVNDGSRDHSLDLIEEKQATNPHVQLISFSRNFGKETAITAGLNHSKGDVTVLMDADFQHPIGLIPELLEHWSKGNDMVYAIRDNRESETLLKRVFTKGFYKLLGFLSATKIPPDAGDFRLLDKKVVAAINDCGEYNRFMKGLYAWVGFQSCSILYNPDQRHGGKSSFSFFRLLELAMTGIISFSDLPLRVWSLIGVVISGLSLFYALVVIIDTLLYGVDVPGYATIVVAIMFFGGVQLISIGILGEYVARIFREVKNRPLYIVDKTLGFDQEKSDGSH